jgi:hypothetical protein
MADSDNVLPISAVEFDPQNARVRTERSSYMIKESLQKFGPLRSLVGQRLPDGRIIVRAGNGTLEEAGQIGIDKVRIIERRADELVVVVADDLDEKDWKSYAIADNRASDLSDWDTDALAEIGEELDLTPWFTSDEIEGWGVDADTSTSRFTPDDEDVFAISEGGTPLAIVLSSSEIKEWNIIKESIGAGSDKAAFLKLMRGEV